MQLQNILYYLAWAGFFDFMMRFDVARTSSSNAITTLEST